jgi:hypothetical protein
VRQLASWAFPAQEPGRFSKSPAEWLPLVRRFAELCKPSAHSNTYAVQGIKQWLVLANHDGRMPWFNTLKRCASLEELLGHLTVLAAVPVTDAA